MGCEEGVACGLLAGWPDDAQLALARVGTATIHGRMDRLGAATPVASSHRAAGLGQVFASVTVRFRQGAVTRYADDELAPRLWASSRARPRKT